MKRKFAVVAGFSLAVLLALGVTHRDQLRAELADAPSVFEHSIAVDLVLQRDPRRRAIGCIRAAPPETVVRSIVGRLDDAVFEWKYGATHVIVRK